MESSKLPLHIMENFKLSQLASSEFKLDATIDFCLNSQGNRMTLIGNSSDICVMDLMYTCDTMVLLPYNVKFVPIPQDKPFVNIVKRVNLIKIYDTSSPQEGQELLLDPIYTAECSIEPPKPRCIAAEMLPNEHANLCCILTTYGVCQIFKKTVLPDEYEPLPNNLLNILISEVFPTKVSPSDIKTYKELKNYVNLYLITSFTWSQCSSELIIFLGTAAGYVVSLKYKEATNEFEEYCKMKTSLDRISYLTICNNILLIGCDQGQVRLIKINYNASSLQELDYLWSKKDRMACRKASISFSESLNSYLVIFCKAAHVLVYRLDLEGLIISSSTLYVSGIKITGLESFTENEFIITTIIGTVKHLIITCPTKEELKIDEHVIEHDFDCANLQILGIGSTKSRNMWSFLLYRNKYYVHKSKYSPTSAFLYVSKLSSQNSLTKLININLKTMNLAQDLVMAINLEIFNNLKIQQYNDYMPLEKLNFPQNFNDAFLQKLQIKLTIIRKIAVFQKIKFKKQKPQNVIELHFLHIIVQLLHILGRLQYLQKLYSSDNKLSSFQELSIVCMQLKFSHLLIDLVSITSDEGNFLHKTAEHASILIPVEFDKCKFQIENIKFKPEHCFTCNDVISATTFDKCEQEHDIKRCSISYTQLSIFQTKYCPHCFALSRNDDDGDLQELFANDEFVKCTFCRFLLKQDIF